MEECPDQRTVTPLVIPEIVTLPPEIDINNADRVGEVLCSAFRSGVPVVVIADGSLTTFCDSAGTRSLLVASDAAAASQSELRVVISSDAVLRILSVLGFDRLLQVYPSLGSALTAGPPPGRRE